MIEFISAHWMDFIRVAVLLLSILLLIIKKPVKSSFESETLLSLIELIPAWINKVEIDGHGDTKKETVLNLALRYVRKAYGRDLTADEDETWRKRASKAIEDILSTPQKKGVCK